MNFPGVSTTTSGPGNAVTIERIDRERDQKQFAPEKFDSSEAQSKTQPEELISQIKSLTENGLYSVQFESNDESGLVMKVVDRESGDVIREIPPEALRELHEQLEELKGLLVDTVG